MDEQRKDEQRKDEPGVGDQGGNKQPAGDHVSSGEAEGEAKSLGRADTPKAVEVQGRCIEILREIYDPEIPVDIYELGLIYEVNVDDAGGKVDIKMTLTSPACPVAGTLPGEVETRVCAADGVDDVDVELVWEPPWSMELLSDAAKLQMGLT